MVTINNRFVPMLHKRKVILGGIMLSCSMICVLMTVLFLYVSNAANKRVEEIRQDYRNVAAWRDARVDLLTDQVTSLQHKLDSLPDRIVPRSKRSIR